LSLFVNYSIVINFWSYFCVGSMWQPTCGHKFSIYRHLMSINFWWRLILHEQSCSDENVINFSSPLSRFSNLLLSQKNCQQWKVLFLASEIKLLFVNFHWTKWFCLSTYIDIENSYTGWPSSITVQFIFFCPQSMRQLNWLEVGLCVGWHNIGCKFYWNFFYVSVFVGCEACFFFGIRPCG